MVWRTTGGKPCAERHIARRNAITLLACSRVGRRCFLFHGICASAKHARTIFIQIPKIATDLLQAISHLMEGEFHHRLAQPLPVCVPIYAESCRRHHVRRRKGRRHVEYKLVCQHVRKEHVRQSALGCAESRVGHCFVAKVTVARFVAVAERNRQMKRSRSNVDT